MRLNVNPGIAIATLAVGTASLFVQPAAAQILPPLPLPLPQLTLPPLLATPTPTPTRTATPTATPTRTPTATPTAVPAGNPIVVENQQSGTDAWVIPNTG